MTHAFSVVIPLFNEVDSITELHEQLKQVAAQVPAWWEFILVDDGSRDGTWDALVELRLHDPRVRAIRLKRNFGQTAAMSCGIDAAHGTVVVTMDGDLQNDPADIPRLVEKLDEGYDVVCGWRHRRQDKMWTRKVPSMIANRLIGWLTGVQLHDYGCSLKVYRSDAIKQTPLYAEFHRFIPAMSTLTGASITELKVNHRSRQYGQTKYNLWRTWKVALDMVTVSLLIKFASKPFRFFGLVACCAAAVSSVCLVRSWQWYVGSYHQIPQVLPGSALLGLWLAGHLLIVGLVAELCLATAHTRPTKLIVPRTLTE